LLLHIVDLIFNNSLFELKGAATVFFFKLILFLVPCVLGSLSFIINFFIPILEKVIDYIVGRDSWVGIAIRYGLDGPGIESRWEVRFSASVQTDPGAHPASYKMGTGSLSRG
jgi:hypothetical protein